MLMRRFLTIGLFFVSTITHSQFSDNFADNELVTNPEWTGDLSDFVVEQGILRLNAPEAGTSQLSTPINLVDDYQWELNFTLDFAPSNSNQLLIYLWSESTDLSSRSLALRIGETGSDDAIALVEFPANLVLAEGVPGRVASDPVDIELRINLNDSFLTVQSRNEDELIFTTEFESVVDSDFIGPGFFGLECNYTSTRTDDFSFDDIVADEAQEDIRAPQIAESLFIPDNQYCLLFDEFVDTDISNVQLEANAQSIVDVQLTESQLKFSIEDISPEEFQLSVSGVFDLAGNELDTAILLKPLFAPEIGDLLINEILFNPFTGGVDFVEIINQSARSLNLQSLVILNSTNNQQDEISSQIEISPNEILAFSEEPEETVALYESAIAENIIITDLPAFNNGDGNVSILFNGELFDAFDYDEDFHNPLVDDVDGVSLERISLQSASNDPSNWTSASQTSGFATPGNQNSTVGNSGTDFSVEISDSFSPNGDNLDDELMIQINTEPGFLATINVYTDTGSLVTTIGNNILLGTQDVITWDGSLDSGDTAPVGIYVVHISVFDENGTTMQEQKAIALVDFLD